MLHIYEHGEDKVHRLFKRRPNREWVNGLRKQQLYIHMYFILRPFADICKSISWVLYSFANRLTQFTLMDNRSKNIWKLKHSL